MPWEGIRLSETGFRSADACPEEGFQHARIEFSSEHDTDFRAEYRALELGAVTVWPMNRRPVISLRPPSLGLSPGDGPGVTV
nr:hypothetical protein GCM10010200_042920 [Actinomadura rugatobispora]